MLDHRECARSSPVCALVALAALAACAACAEIGDPPAAAPPEVEADAEVPSEDAGASDAPDPGRDVPSGDAGGPRYDETQAALEKRRVAGPITVPGSTGVCTDSHFVWRESDGTLHSWAAATKARTDYAFKAPARPYFFPSDSFIVVDLPSSKLGVYMTGRTNQRAAELDYAFHFAAGDRAVLRLDQQIDGAPIKGTKVRRWSSTTFVTEDVSGVLDTTHPPVASANGEIVIPGAVTPPHPLYIVQVGTKTTKTVTFDGGAFQSALPSAEGLLVAYSRSGVPALRLYRGNADTQRLEVGDDLERRPPYFADSTGAREHKFLARMATSGRTLYYASAFGIWAYDFGTGGLAPVQLGAKRTLFVPDVLCVMTKAKLLVYRDQMDTTGQVWLTPLGI